MCKEGFATPGVAYRTTNARRAFLCSRGNASQVQTIDGRGGVLTFSMMLSAVVVG